MVAAATNQKLVKGHKARICIPRWLMNDKMTRSIELVVDVLLVFPSGQAYKVNSRAVVRESDQCLSCDKFIAGGTYRKMGYCPTCAHDVMELPTGDWINVTDFATIKQEVIKQTTLENIVLPVSMVTVLNVFNSPEPEVTKPASKSIAQTGLPKATAKPSRAFPAVKVYVRGGAMYAQSAYYHEELNNTKFKAVGGGQWDKEARAWKWKASPTLALRFKNVFEGYEPALDDSDAEFQALVHDAGNLDAAELIKIATDLPQPPGFKSELWLHQLRAYNYAMAKRGVLLSMSMGTGKTLTTLAISAGRQCNTMLVICPKSVLKVWPHEVRRHVDYPMVVCAPTKGSVAKKVKLMREAIAEGKRTNTPVLVAINYESAIRPPFAPKYGSEAYTKRDGTRGTRTVIVDDGFAREVGFDLVAIDEAHRLGNPQSTTSKFAGDLAETARFRVALTGTPLQHDPLNAWGVMRFVDATVFPKSFAQFKRRYARMGGYMGREIVEWTNLDELQEILARNSFTVGKDVLKLPPQVFSVRYGELSADETLKYREMEKLFEVFLQGGVTQEDLVELAAEMARGSQLPNEATTVAASNVLARLMKLSQMSSGFIMDEEKIPHEIGTSKLDLLEETLSEIDHSEPLVIFVRFVYDIARIRKRLAAKGYRVAELSGSRNQLEEWQKGEYDTLVVQLQSGSEGVNFTWCGGKQCKYCIFFSKDYRWEKHEQSLSRIHRPGQNETTIFITLIMQNTVDETIERVLDKRGDLLKAIIEQRTIAGLHYSKSDDSDESASDDDESDADS